jgi:hypothetical protein
MLCEISGSHGAIMKFRVFWDVAPCSHVEVYRRFIDAYSDAVRTSETSVHFDVITLRYIPEDSELHSESYLNSIFMELLPRAEHLYARKPSNLINDRTVSDGNITSPKYAESQSLQRLFLVSIVTGNFLSVSFRQVLTERSARITPHFCHDPVGSELNKGLISNFENHHVTPSFKPRV